MKALEVELACRRIVDHVLRVVHELPYCVHLAGKSAGFFQQSLFGLLLLNMQVEYGKGDERNQENRCQRNQVYRLQAKFAHIPSSGTAKLAAYTNAQV